MFALKSIKNKHALHLDLYTVNDAIPFYLNQIIHAVPLNIYQVNHVNNKLAMFPLTFIKLTPLVLLTSQINHAVHLEL